MLFFWERDMYRAFTWKVWITADNFALYTRHFWRQTQISQGNKDKDQDLWDNVFGVIGLQQIWTPNRFGINKIQHFRKRNLIFIDFNPIVMLWALRTGKGLKYLTGSWAKGFCIEEWFRPVNGFKEVSHWSQFSQSTVRNTSGVLKKVNMRSQYPDEPD